jgi:hypothetical protein
LPRLRSSQFSHPDRKQIIAKTMDLWSTGPCVFTAKDALVIRTMLALCDFQRRQQLLLADGVHSSMFSGQIAGRLSLIVALIEMTVQQL